LSIETIAIVTLGEIALSGGVQSHSKMIRDGFAELGHPVELFTRENIWRVLLKPGVEFFWIFYKRKNRRVKSFSWYGMELYLRVSQFVMLLSRFIRRPPSVIIVQEVSSFFQSYLLSLIFRARLVLMVHDYFYIGMTGTESVYKDGLVAKIIKREEQLAFRLAKRIITVDKRLYEYVVTYFKRSPLNVHVLYNCPSRDFLAAEKPTTITLKGKNFTHDHFAIACVRRLVPKNGVVFAVRAMARLAGATDIRLYIGGIGDQEKEIREEIARFGLENKVVLLGDLKVREVSLLYGFSDIAVVPSINWMGLEEATSISALEAMAVGLPVVAFSVGGLKDIIADSENGMLVGPEDAQGLARAYETLANRPEVLRTMGEKAKKFIAEHHNYRAYCGDILKVASDEKME
jgi:glycogen synthase